MKEVFYLITTYDFIWRAFVCGLCLTMCASLLGVSLVLRRLSMIGDGLSHISFGAIAIGTALGIAPLSLAIPVAIAASALLFGFGERRIKGDSAIAVISSGALAIGIIMISYTGSGADINNYLIGSLYSVTPSDMAVSLVLGFIVLTSYVFLHNRIFVATFDADFAKATGVSSGAISLFLSVLISLVVVVAMRLMGALLISALIVFPALSAMRVFKSFKSVSICALVISVFSFIVGFMLTLVLDAVPTGACITLTNLVVFIVFCIYSAVSKK